MANNLAMHLGKRLQRAMKERKVTAKVMALHCGVTPGAVSNWFSSGRITKDNLAKAAALLGLSSDDLILGDSSDKFITNHAATPVDSAHAATTNIAELSPDALLLARWFDRLTPGDDALIILHECGKIISAGLLAERASDAQARSDALKKAGAQSRA